MICVDYDYYIETYGGVEMPPFKFNALELRATKHINKITSNRIDFENIDSLGEELCGVRKFLYEKGLLQEFFTSEFYHDTYNNS